MYEGARDFLRVSHVFSFIWPIPTDHVARASAACGADRGLAPLRVGQALADGCKSTAYGRASNVTSQNPNPSAAASITANMSAPGHERHCGLPLTPATLCVRADDATPHAHHTRPECWHRYVVRPAIVAQDRFVVANPVRHSERGMPFLGAPDRSRRTPPRLSRGRLAVEMRGAPRRCLRFCTPGSGKAP
jgi:hypothetical protein